MTFRWLSLSLLLLIVLTAAGCASSRNPRYGRGSGGYYGRSAPVYRPYDYRYERERRERMRERNRRDRYYDRRDDWRRR